MNIFKKLTGTLLLASMALAGCSDDENLHGNAGTGKVSLTSIFAEPGNSDRQYEAVINEAESTIVFELDYYFPNTETRVDITKVTLIADLPEGYSTYPGLDQVFDLTDSQPLTVKDASGNAQQYTVSVKFNKTGDCVLRSFKISGKMANYLSVSGPNESNEIIVTGAVDESLLSAVATDIKTSLYATVTPASGEKVNLNSPVVYTVAAPDGTQQTYTVKFGRPEKLASGIGQIHALFGLKGRDASTGMVLNKNYTCAVADNELILSNLGNGFLRYNRFTGEKLNKLVNVDGTTGTKEKIEAIASDDNGKLIAVNISTFANYSLPSRIKLYKWTNGLDAAPVKFFEIDLNNDLFAPLKQKPAGSYLESEIGHQIAIKGDINGSAQIFLPVSASATESSSVEKRILRLKVEGGNVVLGDELDFIEAPISIGVRAKAIPTSTADNTPYVLGSYSSAKRNFYVGSDRTVVEFASRGNWWPGTTKGIAYTEFNGVKLMALANGNLSGVIQYDRLVLEDITTPATNSFTISQIMDSRLENFDPTVDGTQNTTSSGMTSNFDGISSTTVQNNPNQIVDICFGRTENAVQVYMMAMDSGIIGYEITNYKK